MSVSVMILEQFSMLDGIIGATIGAAGVGAVLVVRGMKAGRIFGYDFVLEREEYFVKKLLVDRDVCAGVPYVSIRWLRYRLTFDK